MAVTCAAISRMSALIASATPLPHGLQPVARAEADDDGRNRSDRERHCQTGDDDRRQEQDVADVPDESADDGKCRLARPGVRHDVEETQAVPRVRG